MQRYMVLEGICGALVSDPSSSDPHMIVGMRRKSKDEMKEGENAANAYVPRKQVCAYHHHLLSAVAKGDLTQHGDYILAESWAEADEKANKKSKSQLQPSKEKGNK